MGGSSQPEAACHLDCSKHIIVPKSTSRASFLRSGWPGCEPFGGTSFRLRHVAFSVSSWRHIQCFINGLGRDAVHCGDLMSYLLLRRGTRERSLILATTMPPSAFSRSRSFSILLTIAMSSPVGVLVEVALPAQEGRPDHVVRIG